MRCDPLLEVVQQVVDGLTRGPLTVTKLVVILVVVVAAAGGVVAYEIQTANFELDKYAKTATLLKDLDALSLSENSSIATTADIIVGRVARILEEHQADRSLSEGQHRVALALILGLPWAVLSMTGIFEGIRKEPDWYYGLFGCLFLASVLGSIGYYLPTDIHWFYRYVVIPLVILTTLLGLLYVAGDDDPASEA